MEVIIGECNVGKDSMQHSVTYLLVTLQCFTGIIWLGLLRLNHLLLRTRSITDDVLQRENYRVSSALAEQVLQSE